MWEVENEIGRERGRERREGEEEREAYSFSFFDIVRARAHRRTILHASTLPSFARFTRVPLSAAENDVEETFVWQLARRRRRRDVFRIRKPVCLYSRTTTNPLLPSHEISRNPPFPRSNERKIGEVWCIPDSPGTIGNQFDLRVDDRRARPSSNFPMFFRAAKHTGNIDLKNVSSFENEKTRG